MAENKFSSITDAKFAAVDALQDLLPVGWFVAYTQGAFSISQSGLSEREVRQIASALNCHQELLDACQQADLQIEYMQSKFKETGSGNAVRQQLQRAIQKAESGG